MAKFEDKDGFYFPHFSNARIDRKIKRIRMQYKLEGYGAFFCILEVLRDQTFLSYPYSDIDILADDFGCSVDLIKSIICDFDLFAFDENGNFFSENLIEYMKPFFIGKERKALGGIKGNLVRYGHVDKDKLTKMSKDQILKAANEAGFDDISIFSLSDRLPTRIASVSDRISSQMKVNEMKLNETNEMKLNEMKSEKNSKREKSFYKFDSQELPYTKSIHDKLVSQYNLKTVEHYYEKIIVYCASTGKKYSDFALTAKNWIDGDIAKGKFAPIVERPEHRMIGYKTCPKCQHSVIDHQSFCDKCQFDFFGFDEKGNRIDYEG